MRQWRSTKSDHSGVRRIRARKHAGGFLRDSSSSLRTVLLYEISMTSHDANLPALIDHTMLRPDATKQDVLRLCQEAMQFGFLVVFVPPCYVEEAVKAVADSGIRVGIPIGFPLGGHTTKSKVAEALEAVACGAKIL